MIVYQSHAKNISINSFHQADKDHLSKCYLNVLKISRKLIYHNKKLLKVLMLAGWEPDKK